MQIIGLIIFFVLLIGSTVGIYFIFKKLGPCPTGQIRDSTLNNKCRKKCDDNEIYYPHIDSCLQCPPGQTKCLKTDGTCDRSWSTDETCCTTKKCIQGKPCDNPCGTDNCCSPTQSCNPDTNTCLDCPDGQIRCGNGCCDKSKCANNSCCETRSCVDVEGGTDRRICFNSNCVDFNGECYCCPQGKTYENGVCVIKCGDKTCKANEFCLGGNTCAPDPCNWKDIPDFVPESINAPGNQKVSVCQAFMNSSVTGFAGKKQFSMVRDPNGIGSDMSRTVSYISQDLQKCSSEFCTNKIASQNLTNATYDASQGNCKGIFDCKTQLPLKSGAENTCNTELGTSCCYARDTSNKLVFTGLVCPLNNPCVRNLCICRGKEDDSCISKAVAASYLCSNNGVINMDADPRTSNSICTCNLGYAGDSCNRFVNFQLGDKNYTPIPQTKAFEVSSSGVNRFTVVGLPGVNYSVTPIPEFIGTCVDNNRLVHECSFGIGDVAVKITVGKEFVILKQDGPGADLKDPHKPAGNTEGLKQANGNFSNYKIIPSNHLKPGFDGQTYYEQNLTLPLVIIGQSAGIN